jgi:hypothetical protein
MSRCVVVFLVLGPLLGGCVHHQVGFNAEDPSWHHSVEGEPLAIAIAATVPTETQLAEHEISSAMAGFANRWHARYGEMFLQVLGVELSQLFASHSLAAPPATPDSYHLELDIPAYSFSGFAAHVTVSAVLRDPSGTELLNKRYEAVGRSGAGKAVGLGAFGMRSAVRQSTLNAYLQILEQLRGDLRSSL